MPPYRLLYKAGFAPWERRDVAATWNGIMDALGNPAPGRALDIGCGTGRDSVHLAKQEWRVTGVDYVADALAKARERAAQEGAQVEWVQGDVGRLGQLGLEPGYDLIYDFGCIQGLPEDARRGAAAGVGQLAAPEASLFVFAFKAGRRFLLPHGLDQADVIALFGPSWELRHSQPAPVDGLPPWLRSATPTIYRLGRRGGAT